VCAVLILWLLACRINCSFCYMVFDNFRKAEFIFSFFMVYLFGQFTARPIWHHNVVHWNWYRWCECTRRTDFMKLLMFSVIQNSVHISNTHWMRSTNGNKWKCNGLENVLIYVCVISYTLYVLRQTFIYERFSTPAVYIMMCIWTTLRYRGTVQFLSL
jgi:hypothetical protein